MERRTEDDITMTTGEVYSVDVECQDAAHMMTCPHTTVACLMERALQAGIGNEHVEALLLGLGAAIVCYLLWYAIAILAKLQVGIFALALG